MVEIKSQQSLSTLGVKILLDAPCGNSWWISHVDLTLNKYIGVDIVQDLITKNSQKFRNQKNMQFRCLDLVSDPLPYADLILCRDCLIHLTNDDCIAMLTNFKNSGAKYLLCSTHTNISSNPDHKTGQTRFVNLQLPPFNFTSPLYLIQEEQAGKALGLWNIEDILN